MRFKNIFDLKKNQYDIFLVFPMLLMRRCQKPKKNLKNIYYNIFLNKKHFLKKSYNTIPNIHALT
jgi:hypothetical protein